jgi:hypothetical protein
VLLFSTCSGLDQLPDDQLPLKEITITKVTCSNVPAFSLVYLNMSGISESSPAYYYDFSCTKSLSFADLMTIPNHTIKTYDYTTAAVTPILEPTVATTATFDTSTVIYARNDHVGIGPKLISKYHIVTPSMAITYE